MEFDPKFIFIQMIHFSFKKSLHHLCGILPFYRYYQDVTAGIMKEGLTLAAFGNVCKN